MSKKLLKKFLGSIGYKIIEKNHVKNQRSVNKNSIININFVLEKIFNFKKINNLIQIGANDGEIFDDLKNFINKYECQSILIEPIPKYFHDLKEKYKGKKNIFLENIAISDDQKENYIYCVKEKFIKIYDNHIRGLNSFNKNHLLKHDVKKNHIEKIKINCLTITELLNKYTINELDLLYVDAEGYDGNIILDLLTNTQVLPVIIFEYIHIKNEIFEKVLEKLKIKNYKLFPLNENLVCFLDKDNFL